MNDRGQNMIAFAEAGLELLRDVMEGEGNAKRDSEAEGERKGKANI